MNLDKLKEVARRHELREDWRKAIEIYQRALSELAESGEPADPSLFNRIGDLELKAGESASALRAYEQAADTYADQGFFNNAIALCGKILRVNPGRTATYLRLAELNARKNVLAEARRNLGEYVERMAASSQLVQAAEPLRGFAERFGGSGELRGALDELLQTLRERDSGEGVEALARAIGGEGTAPPADGSAAGAPSTRRLPQGDLVFLDTGVEIPGLIRQHGTLDTEAVGTGTTADVTTGLSLEAGPAPAVEPLPFIEPTAIGMEVSAPDGPSGLAGLEPTFLGPDDLAVGLVEPLITREVPEDVPVEGLEPLSAFEAPGADLALEPLSLEPDALQPMSLHEGPPAPAPDATIASPAPMEPLFDELDVEDEPAVQRVVPGQAPPGPPVHLPPEAGPEELEALLSTFVAEERWGEALGVLGELIRHAPDRVEWHQHRVELAYRSGERRPLVAAYLSLAQTLERLGARDNAVLVYHRVLDHDVANPAAEAALLRLGAPGAPGVAAYPPRGPREGERPGVEGGSEFVDLGALILEPEPDRDTRMRVEAPEPVGDEDRDFLETLAQFKQGVEANVDAGDYKTHFDLGIAFKEMGLLDEAIAQFQKSLRAPETRLSSAESLGQAFYEKGRFGIAEGVLARAVDALPGGDDEKIGLIYWRGRALEAQGRREEALRWYERALAVDITFLDLSERIQRLTAENAS